MAFVEDGLGDPTGPADVVTEDLDIDRAEDRPQGRKGKRFALATLESGDHVLADGRPRRQVRLAPALPDPQRPNEAAEPACVHG